MFVLFLFFFFLFSFLITIPTFLRLESDATTHPGNTKKKIFFLTTTTTTTTENKLLFCFVLRLNYGDGAYPGNYLYLFCFRGVKKPKKKKKLRRLPCVIIVLMLTVGFVYFEKKWLAKKSFCLLFNHMLCCHLTPSPSHTHTKTKLKKTFDPRSYYMPFENHTISVNCIVPG